MVSPAVAGPEISMKVGDQVIVDGYMAKDGSNLANAEI